MLYKDLICFCLKVFRYALPFFVGCYGLNSEQSCSKYCAFAIIETPATTLATAAVTASIAASHTCTAYTFCLIKFFTCFATKSTYTHKQQAQSDMSTGIAVKACACVAAQVAVFRFAPASVTR